MPARTKRILPAAILLAVVTALGMTAVAFGQSVGVSIASQQAYVGSPVRLVVAIENAEAFDGPFVPEVDGLEIRRLPGEQTSSSFQIINGKTTQNRSVAISYEVIPQRVGNFVIPGFEVEINGTRQRTRDIPISAVVSETGDLLLVRVVSSPRTLFVGQQGRIELRIAVRRYRDKEFGVTLDERDLWSLMDRDSQFGVFGPALAQLGSQNRLPRSAPEIIGDTEYIVYTIEKPFDPISTGTPDLGDIRIRMNYPERLRRTSDFFDRNRLQIANARPITATPSEVLVDVASPPEGGRPGLWNGAVGAFTVEAVAKPTDVAVGDPITLTLRVTDTSGTAGLEGLQAPVLRDQGAFVGAFRVPDEPASGTVEGRSKIFTQSIRATSDTVREIPSVEFAFFDPATGSYETVRSAPVPLRVRPSAMVRLADDAARASEAGPGAGFTRVEGGLLANASREEMGARVRPIDADELLALAIAPAVLGAAALVRRRVALEQRDPTSRRRRTAAATARARLEQANDAETVGAALRGYIADRIGAPEGSLTRRECMDALAADALAAQLVETADELLRRCERARYSGERVEASEATPILAMLEASWTHVPAEPPGRGGGR